MCKSDLLCSAFLAYECAPFILISQMSLSSYVLVFFFSDRVNRLIKKAFKYQASWRRKEHTNICEGAPHLFLFKVTSFAHPSLLLTSVTQVK